MSRRVGDPSPASPVGFEHSGTTTDVTVAAGDDFVVADLGNGLIASLTQIRTPNPVGPVAAGTVDVLFVANPVVLTLPETGTAMTLLWRLAALLSGLGLLLVAVSSRRLPRRTIRRRIPA